MTTQLLLAALLAAQPEPGVPAKVRTAFDALREQGLAAPRGLPFHVIRLGPPDGIETHYVWLLPETPRQTQRFALGFDGLKHPLAGVGDKADLATIIEAAAKSPHTYAGGPTLGRMTVGCLLRVGADDLAANPWHDLGDTFAFRVALPTPAEMVEGFAPRFRADSDLTFGLVLCNRTGLDQPADRGVRVRLFHTPATITRQGALAPRADDWREVAAVDQRPWTPTGDRPLTPTEVRTVATVDLRKEFGVKDGGFYRIVLAGPGQRAAVAEFVFSLAPARGQP